MGFSAWNIGSLSAGKQNFTWLNRFELSLWLLKVSLQDEFIEMNAHKQLPKSQRIQIKKSFNTAAIFCMYSSPLRKVSEQPICSQKGREKLIKRIYTPKTHALHNFSRFGPQNWIQSPSAVTTFTEIRESSSSALSRREADESSGLCTSAGSLF